ncbi:DDE-type integrase/transposase/recombinase [Vibrio sp. B172a]|nr:DDE-type integrase/transposase/recombinase [Vibrio sp. B172a]
MSYRELAEMLEERDVDEDQSTIYRWVQKLERRLRWHWKLAWVSSWQLDETYVKVKGRWMSLYRPMTNTGETVDFYVSSPPRAKAAQRFLGEALRSIKPILNTDKARAYISAIEENEKLKHLENSEWQAMYSLI